MRYGRTVEPGFLPVFSVDTEEEAKRLLGAACELSREGHGYIARELVRAQTQENLAAFSDRLEKVWALINK